MWPLHAHDCHFIWAGPRHIASAPEADYCCIALDVDMAHDPVWMHGALSLLAARTAAGSATSLPLRSFDMEAQHELAFRTLQSGLNTGKIVVRVATRPSVDGDHIVTGGTSGIGLLTGRWFAQRGARCLVLVSRSGTLSRDAANEWKVIEASNALARALDLHQHWTCTGIALAHDMGVPKGAGASTA